MRVGVAAIGYGDGYPRHARNGTPVSLNGKRAALVGHVSMDMITIDLRGHEEAGVGDQLTLWGEGLPLEEVAQWCDAIPWQLICGVTARVKAVVS
jgi:alanine racemase